MAFSLQPGQFSQTPIHNEFGWHIVKVEERRIVAPPAYSDVHDALRKMLLQEAVQEEVSKARAQLTIRKFNMDGSALGPVPDTTPVQPLVKPQDSPRPQALTAPGVRQRPAGRSAQGREPRGAAAQRCPRVAT